MTPAPHPAPPSPPAQVYFRRRAAESLRVDGLWELGDAPQALLQCFSPCGQHLVGEPRAPVAPRPAQTSPHLKYM